MTDRSRLADHADRERITTDLASSLLVEAAAGTGKTTSMVARMMALLRGGHAQIANLAAMTFTVKAAGHLREKFAQALRSAIRESTNPEERARLVSAIDQIDRPFIGTIHSFCATLLREHPLEAGIAPAFTVVDETEAAMLQTAVFHDFMRGVGGGAAAATALLEERDIPLAALRDAYLQLCAHPDVYFPAPGVPEPDLTDAHAELVRLVEDLDGLFSPSATPDREDDLQQLLRATMRREWRHASDSAQVVQLLSPFRRGAGLVRLRSWRGMVDDPKTVVRDRVADFAKRHVDPALRRWEEYLYPLIVTRARDIAAHWHAEKARRGLLTNNDLLLRARDVLRDHAEVRTQIQQRFTHLLVDEFQDTDPVQAEIILYIVGDAHAERDWRKLRPRPGALFIVGDPRQSIYRFRRADISVYNAVASILENSGPARLYLSSSFRALPALCDWVNKRFAAVFPAKDSPAQARHSPISSVRSAEGTLRGTYALPITYGSMRSPATMLEQEAALLAHWTASALAADIQIPVRHDDGSETLRPLAPRDILLLTPTNAGIDAFAAAMEQRNIAVTVAGGYALRDGDTLRPLMHILHALADPLDEISVVAFLRGPYCGADDAALADYRARGGQFTFFSPVIKGADPRILDGLAFLKGKVRLLRSFPPAAVVGSIIEEAGLMAWTAAADRGNLRAGTLQRLVEFVQHASARGLALAAIVAQLDTAMARSRIDGMALFPDENAMRIMNVHKAKGLEAPVVILARHSSQQSGRDRQTVCIDRRAQPPRGVMRVQQRFPGGGGIQVAAPRDWEEVRGAEQRFLDAERERLQYVAATRAESALIVVRRTNESTQADSWDILLTGAMQDAPQFPVARSSATEQNAGPSSPLQAAQDIARRREEAGVKRYALQSPSRLAHASRPAGHHPHGEDEDRPGAARGGGKDFGKAVHELLETALRDDVQQAVDLLDQVAAEFEVDVALQPRLRELLSDVAAHPLWKRMRQATRCYPEFSFGAPVTTGEDALPTALSGIIDVVFEDEEGWTIVDYKTDDVRDAEDPRVDQYRLQVAAYRDAWERITGQRPRTVLWFVATGLITD
ncbi:MAG: UvrD-helicase domain-containing protein [Bacteroidota bacterium]|nr:UvrD-helicase domain-containing protein [Bacteroidota bacterium]